MPSRRPYVTDAIVLSRFELGEADRVLTVITPDYGKLKIIAKGVRRPTSRLGGSLEPFAELRIALSHGRTFEHVTQVSIAHAWLAMRDSLESAATAWYLAELAERSSEERAVSEPLYTLLRRAYELLDGGMAPARVARWYEMRLADELGQRPEVDRCVECDRMLEADGTFRWVPVLGGVLCERHPAPPAWRVDLSLEALKLLKAYQRMDAEALAGLRLSASVEREAEAVMREFVRQCSSATRARRPSSTRCAPGTDRCGVEACFVARPYHGPAPRHEGERSWSTAAGSGVSRAGFDGGTRVRRPTSRPSDGARPPAGSATVDR